MARRILCVDDDPALAELCGDLCEAMGLDFIIETNPHEALRLFTEDPEQFAAVIVDQLMPKMRGEELAKHLVRIRPGIPIILITGNPENVPESLEEIGVRGVLIKPVTKREFTDTVATALA
jgi:two-component system, cell cycle sensor histidine kinase and response regulator CckA